MTIELLIQIWKISFFISIGTSILLFLFLEKGIEVDDSGFWGNFPFFQFYYILAFAGIYLFFGRISTGFFLINCVLVNLVNIAFIYVIVRLIVNRSKRKNLQMVQRKNSRIGELSRSQDTNLQNIRTYEEKIQEVQQEIEKIEFFIREEYIWTNLLKETKYFDKEHKFNSAGTNIFLAGFSFYQEFEVTSLSSDFFFFLLHSARFYYLAGDFSFANGLLGSYDEKNDLFYAKIDDKHYRCNKLFEFLNIDDQGEKIRRGILIGLMLIEVHMEKRAMGIIIYCKNLLENSIGSGNQTVRALKQIISNTYTDNDLLDYRFDDLKKTMFANFERLRLEQSRFYTQLLNKMDDYQRDLRSIDNRVNNLSAGLKIGLQEISYNIDTLNNKVDSNFDSLSDSVNSGLTSVNRNIDTTRRDINYLYDRLLY